ncbi:TPA: hypothetical protein ACUQSE_001928 [Escherichia coli]
MFEWVAFCCAGSFPALFLPETFINTLALSAGLMACFRHLVALSNLIYPFASILHPIDNAALLTHEIFLISHGGKIQGFDTKNRLDFARKTNDLLNSLIYIVMFIFSIYLRFSDFNHSF